MVFHISYFFQISINKTLVQPLQVVHEWVEVPSEVSSISNERQKVCSILELSTSSTSKDLDTSSSESESKNLISHKELVNFNMVKESTIGGWFEKQIYFKKVQESKPLTNNLELIRGPKKTSVAILALVVQPLLVALQVHKVILQQMFLLGKLDVFIRFLILHLTILKICISLNFKYNNCF